MEKNIWILNNNRQEMMDIQRIINSTGSMRAIAIVSENALSKAIDRLLGDGDITHHWPSLIIIDYAMSVGEDFASYKTIRNNELLVGVPLFFTTEERNTELDEDCYSRGAAVVLKKPISKSGILRIERMAWQYEVTKNFEKVIQKQVGDLQAAKEIKRLNEQLQARNELLYNIFGRYFSESILENILEKPENCGIGGEKRELTVLMSDLRGFTSMSEKIGPDAVTEILNLYFEKMADAINAYHGTIIEFLGDSVLAVFGAPIQSENQTEEAIAAAICMQNAMEEVNEFCRKKNFTSLEMGIAINRGEVFIGNVGSDRMMRYNVIGSTVNECSRIESFSIGRQILISSDALAHVKCDVDIINDMDVNAKGLNKRVSVSEVLGIGEPYNVRVNDVQCNVMSWVYDMVIFNLFRLEGKHISEMPVASRLLEFSRKRVVVQLLEDAPELDVLSDVEIFAARGNGRAAFTGVYAKVIEKDDQRLTLHFTHINRGFEQFCENVAKQMTE